MMRIVKTGLAIGGGGALIVIVSINWQKFKSAFNSLTRKTNSVPPEEETLTEIVWKELKGSKVEVSGSFSGWKAIPLDKDTEGRFRTALCLPPGTYEFKFIVDGEWCCSPDYDIRHNDLGSSNNILVV